MGVGRLLMTALIEVAVTWGVPAINLVTGTFNEVAVCLYHSCGFRDVAQQGEAVKMRLALAHKPEPPAHGYPAQPVNRDQNGFVPAMWHNAGAGSGNPRVRCGPFFTPFALALGANTRPLPPAT